MRKIIKLALSCLMLTLAALPISAQNISIGAWNIQWLGSAGQRPNAAKNIEQTPQDLAFYIGSSGVSLLALEEISDTDGIPGQYTNRVLDRTMQRLSTGGNRWRYLLFPKKSPNSSTQLVGIAWNERVLRPVGAPFRVPLNVLADDSAWDRWATAMKFSTGSNRTDFVVVPLHMKSNVGGAEVTRPQRAREAQQLVDALQSIRTRFGDDDIVLMGDTNVLNRNEPAISVYTAAGFADLNDADRPTDIRGTPFDRAFVFRGQPEFAATQQSAFILPNLSRNNFFVRFSDHYMIRLLLRSMADDD